MSLSDTHYAFKVNGEAACGSKSKKVTNVFPYRVDCLKCIKILSERKSGVTQVGLFDAK